MVSYIPDIQGIPDFPDILHFWIYLISLNFLIISESFLLHGIPDTLGNLDIPCIPNIAIPTDLILIPNIFSIPKILTILGNLGIPLISGIPDIFYA